MFFVEKQFVYKENALKMLSVIWQPFCPSFNVLSKRQTFTVLVFLWCMQCSELSIKSELSISCVRQSHSIKIQPCNTKFVIPMAFEADIYIVQTQTNILNCSIIKILIELGLMMKVFSNQI